MNNILPKPSIVLQSLTELIDNYNLIWNYLTTISAIYLSLIFAYFVTIILFPFIIKENFFAHVIHSLEWFTRYLPGILLGLLLIMWFPQSEFTAFVFVFLIALTSIISHSKWLTESLDPNYYNSIKTFGVSDITIYRNIFWKAIEPDLLKFICKQNIYLWMSILIFEFINLRSGLGVILRQIVQYKDLSALVMYLIIVGVSIFVSSHFLNFLRSKFFYWKI